MVYVGGKLFLKWSIFFFNNSLIARIEDVKKREGGKSGDLGWREAAEEGGVEEEDSKSPSVGVIKILTCRFFLLCCDEKKQNKKHKKTIVN